MAAEEAKFKPADEQISNYPVDCGWARLGGWTKGESLLKLETIALSDETNQGNEQSGGGGGGRGKVALSLMMIIIIRNLNLLSMDT